MSNIPDSTFQNVSFHLPLDQDPYHSQNLNGDFSPSLFLIKQGEASKSATHQEDDMVANLSQQTKPPDNERAYYSKFQSSTAVCSNMSDLCFSSILTEDVQMKNPEFDRSSSTRDLNEPRIFIKNGTQVNIFLPQQMQQRLNNYQEEEKQLPILPHSTSSPFSGYSQLQISDSGSCGSASSNSHQEFSNESMLSMSSGEKTKGGYQFMKFQTGMKKKNKRQDLIFKSVVRGFRKSYIKKFNSVTSYQKNKRKFQKFGQENEYLCSQLEAFVRVILEESDHPVNATVQFQNELVFVLGAIYYSSEMKQIYENDQEKLRMIQVFSRIFESYSNFALFELLKNEAFKFLFQEFLVKEQQSFIRQIKQDDKLNEKNYEKAFEFLKELCKGI